MIVSEHRVLVKSKSPFVLLEHTVGWKTEQHVPLRTLNATLASDSTPLLLPPFCPPVLKPGLHLCVRHLQRLGQGGALGRGQVLLPVKALLQLADLHPAEGGSRLFPLGRRPVLVRVADAAGHGEGRQGSWEGAEKQGS